MTKVLILDQSKSVRNILRERLEYEGFSAEAVENEAAASALCERIPFDVILSDTECKVPDAGIPFIALSADTSIDTAVKAVRNGAQDFLTKPIDMNHLLQSMLLLQHIVQTEIPILFQKIPTYEPYNPL